MLARVVFIINSVAHAYQHLEMTENIKLSPARHLLQFFKENSEGFGRWPPKIFRIEDDLIPNPVQRAEGIIERIALQHFPRFLLIDVWLTDFNACPDDQFPGELSAAALQFS